MIIYNHFKTLEISLERYFTKEHNNKRRRKNTGGSLKSKISFMGKIKHHKSYQGFPSSYLCLTLKLWYQWKLEILFFFFNYLFIGLPGLINTKKNLIISHENL